jgi:hypothetical protein
MKRLLAILLLACPMTAFASVGNNTNWDVQTTGANTNGGAFDLGVTSPGTDESMGAGTAITVTLASGTTGTGSPAFTATTHGPGNFIHIASGTGCSTGWYEINSQAAGVATFSSTMGSTGNTCVGVIGGSLLTVGQAVTNWNSLSGGTGQVVNVQSGTYTITSTLNVNNGGGVYSLFFVGYGATHGDNGTPPLITTSTNTPMFTRNSGGFAVFVNMHFSSTASPRNVGFRADDSGTAYSFIDSQLSGFSNCIDGNVAQTISQINLWHTEITSCTGVGVYDQSNFIFVGGGSWIHGNGSYGVELNNHAQLQCSGSIISGNSGSGVFGNSSIGWLWSDHCDYVSNTGSGIDAANGFDTNSQNQRPNWLHNNVFYSNTLYGFKAPANFGTLANGYNLASRNNAYGANGTAPTLNFTDSSPITLGVSPFVSSTNFAPNTAATGGALLTGAGYPGPIGTTTTNYPPVGAVTNQAATAAVSNYGSVN